MKKRVMLVEDEEFILQGILCIVDWASVGMEVVHTAHNGQEALEKFMEDPVDLIVTDVEMPLMDGLELMREIRKKDTRVRCLILSGYDEFEYARTALSLDVDDYILKPVNDEKLTEALQKAGKRLDDMDRKQAANMEDKIGWALFLKGKGGLKEEERKNLIEMLPEIKEGSRIIPALMKIDLETVGETEGITPILIEFRTRPEKIRPIYLKADVLLLLYYCGEETGTGDAERIFGESQNRIESGSGIMTFLAVGPMISSYEELPESYQRMNHLLRYRIMTGYGRCVSEESISKKGGHDIAVDLTLLRKKILEKDQDGALQYLENLFISLVEAGSDIDAVYQNALKVILLLQDIKTEYKIRDPKTVRSLTEIFDHIYQAEDIAGMRTVLVLEITAVIMALHTEDSHYTPVIREILSYIQENYREDLSLKILSYKYHMNTSYLGQIFQKEVGCPFNQYLSNMKNEKAKEMILNTNMKINDIAREVFDTEKMQSTLDTMREYYEKGYINKDAATASDDKSVKRFVTKGDGQPYAELVWAKDLQYEVVASPIMDTQVTNASARGALTAINANSEHPEKAMEFLNLVNTDQYLRNLLNYGIEGTHWERVEVPQEELDAAEGKPYIYDCKVKLDPEKSKDYSVPYYVQGGLFNTYVLDNEPIDKWATFKEFNDEAQEAPSFGFDFDLTEVSTQVAGFRNILDEFGKSLYTGSVDPDEYVPQLEKKMEATGIDDVIKEMQKQIDEWKTEK